MMAWVDTSTSNSTWASPTATSSNWINYCDQTTSATTAYIYYPMFVVTTSDTVTLTVPTRAQPARQQSRAEAEAEAAAIRERVAAAEIAARERQAMRAAAQERAKQLLLDHLTDEQRATVERHGWFVVEGGRTKKRYRISPNAHAGNVHELEGDRPIATYCCHVDHQYPAHDNALAQKLILEHDEQEFLRLANKRAA